MPAVQPSTTRVVAPTATPEDSYVEGGSSSCGAELDALPIEQSGAPDPDTIAAAAESAAALTVSCAAQRPHDHIVTDDRRTLHPSCLYTQSTLETARLSTTSVDSATQRPATATAQRHAAVKRIHRAIAGARQRLLRQLGHRAVADEKPTTSTAFCDDDQSLSFISAADSQEATSSRSILPGKAPTAAVEADVCSSVGSSTVALSDNAGSDVETLAADTSMVLGGRRISPGSPSYDEKHVRFSHVGAHALDVFYSPDDDDDNDDTLSDRSDSGKALASSSSLWRPLASCSGVLQEQSSTSTSLHVPTRFVASVTSDVRLPSLPEAVWRQYGSDDDGSDTVHELAGDVKPMSSVLAVLSPTEATRSSALAYSDNCSSVTNIESEGLQPVVSDSRFVLFYFMHLNNKKI